MNTIALPGRPFAGLKRALQGLSPTGDTIGVAIASAILFGLVFGAGHSFARGPIAPHQALPHAPAMAIRALDADRALAVNRDIPVAKLPNPAAFPFRLAGTPASRADALECLSEAVYYEAGGQSDDGQRAVAQVILNRVRHPAFPASVCAVVYQGSTRITGCQFTFTCDGSLLRRPDAAGWRRASLAARSLLSGEVFAPVGWATHYHADYVVPYWASTLVKNAVVGAHLFYRWTGGWGLPGAFAQKYSGHESAAASLRIAALEAEALAAAAADGAPNPDSAELALERVAGVEAIKLEPSLRGDKRVELRFNQTARKAAEEATHKDYGDTFEASDNLRWSLSGNATVGAEKPLGKAVSDQIGSSVAASAMKP